MKLIVVLALVGLAVGRPDGDFYNLKYSDDNVNEVLTNDRLIKAYLECFRGTGPCTKEGTEAKGLMKNGIETSCTKCTPRDKETIAKFMKAGRNKYPDIYQDIYKAHDPEGKKTAEHEEFIATYAP